VIVKSPGVKVLDSAKSKTARSTTGRSGSISAGAVQTLGALRGRLCKPDQEMLVPPRSLSVKPTF
jgi:hypothetical protein